MKIIMLIVMFFLIGAFFIISENRLDLKTSGNLDNFTSLYLGWLGRISGNVGGLTGYVIDLKWLPGESAEK